MSPQAEVGAFSSHPWSRDFAWVAGRATSGVLDADAVERFDRDGYLVLEGVLDHATVDEVRREIDRFEMETAAVLRHQPDERLFIAEAGAITFTPHLVGRSEIVRVFAAHPVFVGLCRDLIGPDVRLYWDQAVYKSPAKPRRFPWHQDNGYTFVEPQQYLTCWVPLVDATVENGCPWVVPGVHRHGTLSHRFVDPLGFECFSEHPDAVAVPAAAGDVVVLSSLTPHLTGPNASREVRKTYILQYAPEGTRTLLGQPVDGPPTGSLPCDDIVRQFPVLAGGEPVPPPATD